MSALRVLWAVLGAALLSTACADIPGLTPMPPAFPEAPVPGPAPYTPEEGSLWRGDESRRLLAFENRARGVGDLLTVEIIEEASAENEATTELDRTSSLSATIDSDISLQTIITRPILGVLNFLGFSDQHRDRAPTAAVDVVDASTSSKFDGEGATSREASFTTTIACLVTEVTPSGLLRIEGQRHLRISNDTQVIRLSGLVRPEDVQINNTVSSRLIAQADIEYGGVGAVAEKQRAPWGMRLLELILPF